MNTKLVSIAMCTYNGQRFIKEQLDSILNQTYANLEIIIVDDCSSDKTVDILNEYAANDKRIIFHQNKTNLGYLKNFEKAISLCNGEFIALADQDDIFKEKKIETFVQEIKENILIYSDAIIIDDNSKEVGKELVRPNRCLISGGCNKALLLGNCVSGNTLMFKKELVEYILPIPQNISYHDIWITFVASTYATISYTDESMTYYRRYAQQVTHNPQVMSKNFFDKLEQKKEIKIKEMKVILKDLEVLSTLDILKGSQTLVVINLLINHFQNYQNIFFNFALHRALSRYSNEIFGDMISIALMSLPCKPPAERWPLPA